MKSVYEYFQGTVNKYPEKIAVDDGHNKMKFQELERSAAAMGSAIINILGGRRGKPIIIFMPKSVEAVVSFLGVNFSGNCYVPLEVQQPKRRSIKMIETLNGEIIITTREYREKLPLLNLNKQQYVFYEDLIQHTVDRDNIHRMQRKIIDMDPLYIKFTSGSSGEPKGVVLSQRAVLDYMICFEKEIGMDAGQISGCMSPLHFDNSVHDIYGMICYGSTAVLLPENCLMFPLEFLSIVDEKKINVLWWPTSAIASFVSSQIKDVKKILENITVLTIVGEVLQVKHLNKIADYMPYAKIYNLYGPTETAVTSTYYHISRKFDITEMIPIGSPFQNTDIFLLDMEQKLVKEPGNYGEICIRGSSLAGGYYNNLEKTSQVFVQNPCNPHYNELIYRTGDVGTYNEEGELMYIGRRDFQIKHQGRRIELGEIEAAAVNLKELGECCCIYDPSEEKIILFYTALEEIPRKKFLSEMLMQIPKYMLPNQLCYLEKMPYNSHCKLDRMELKRMYEKGRKKNE